MPKTGEQSSQGVGRKTILGWMVEFIRHGWEEHRLLLVLFLLANVFAIGSVASMLVMIL